MHTMDFPEHKRMAIVQVQVIIRRLDPVPHRVAFGVDFQSVNGFEEADRRGRAAEPEEARSGLLPLHASCCMLQPLSLLLLHCFGPSLPESFYNTTTITTPHTRTS